MKRTPNQLIRHTQSTINKAFKLQKKLHIRMKEVNDLVCMLDGIFAHLDLLIKDIKEQKAKSDDE